jgi:hypothetical protein
VLSDFQVTYLDIGLLLAPVHENEYVFLCSNMRRVHILRKALSDSGGNSNRSPGRWNNRLISCLANTGCRIKSYKTGEIWTFQV